MLNWNSWASFKNILFYSWIHRHTSIMCLIFFVQFKNETKMIWILVLNPAHIPITTHSSNIVQNALAADVIACQTCISYFLVVFLHPTTFFFSSFESVFIENFKLFFFIFINRNNVLLKKSFCTLNISVEKESLKGEEIKGKNDLDIRKAYTSEAYLKMHNIVENEKSEMVFDHKQGRSWLHDTFPVKR